MPDTSKPASREEIVELIGTLISAYYDMGRAEGQDPADPPVTAFYVVGEVLCTCGRRHRVEITDPTSSRHTSMGLLFAALHDPDWLDDHRVEPDE